jgi:hypothetical protein
MINTSENDLGSLTQCWKSLARKGALGQLRIHPTSNPKPSNPINTATTVIGHIYLLAQ